MPFAVVLPLALHQAMATVDSQDPGKSTVILLLHSGPTIDNTTTIDSPCPGKSTVILLLHSGPTIDNTTTMDRPCPGKSTAIPLLHGNLQFIMLQKKNNHIPYNMRRQKCPPSSTRFWYLLRKCAFTCINSSSKIQSIPRLILAFNSCNTFGLIACILYFKYPI